MVIYKYPVLFLHSPTFVGANSWSARGEEQMFQPQIRQLTRVLPAIALVVVGLALILMLFR